MLLFCFTVFSPFLKGEAAIAAGGFALILNIRANSSQSPFKKGEVNLLGQEMIIYSKTTKPLARELRNNQTGAEVLLWSRIRGKQILGVTFNRQKPLGRYIVDFYSFSTKLVIELDGSQHFEPDALAYDFERTKMLESLGLKVIRFDNSQVFNELESVLAGIYAEVEKRRGLAV